MGERCPSRRPSHAVFGELPELDQAALQSLPKMSAGLAERDERAGKVKKTVVVGADAN
jgi:hypothetical protein